MMMMMINVQNRSLYVS